MANLTITSSLLSDELIDEITTYIKDDLEREERRAVPMDSVYNFFSYKAPDLLAHQFKGALSKSVAEKRLPGLAMKMGKAGGIGIDDGTVQAPRKPSKPREKKVAKAKSAAPVIASHSEDASTDIAIGEKQYVLPMTAESVEKLFVPIFDLTPNDEGDIEIGDKKFTANSNDANKYIENCIWYMLKNAGANIVTENDDSEEDISDESPEEVRKTA